MTKIVISYRRSDSGVFAGRVHDRIIGRYGDRSAFMDVDNIPFGKDFRVHIQQELANADAVLVIIGPKWLASTKDGRSRIMEATDPVRIEVETALSKGIPTIPILMGNSRMPKPEQLPETLKDFAFLNAAPVDTSRDFHRDLSRVIATIDQIIGLSLDTLDSHNRANDDNRAEDGGNQTQRDRLAGEAQSTRTLGAAKLPGDVENKSLVTAKNPQAAMLDVPLIGPRDEQLAKAVSKTDADRDPMRGTPIPRNVGSRLLDVALPILVVAGILVTVFFLSSH